MSVAADPQTRLDERTIESTELESILEERAGAKEKAALAVQTAKGFDERARALIDELVTDEEAVVRVGRFRVTKSKVPARSVAFETSPTSRVRISTVDA